MDAGQNPPLSRGHGGRIARIAMVRESRSTLLMKASNGSQIHGGFPKFKTNTLAWSLCYSNTTFSVKLIGWPGMQA